MKKNAFLFALLSVGMLLTSGCNNKKTDVTTTVSAGASSSVHTSTSANPITSAKTSVSVTPTTSAKTSVSVTPSSSSNTTSAAPSTSANTTSATPSSSANTTSAAPSTSVAPLKTYTVTWKNYDGTVLETDNDVKEGSTPTYDGETPIKVADATSYYDFAGWGDVSSVTSDVIYTAVFTAKAHVFCTFTYTYNSTSQTYSLAGNSKNATAVVIPATANDGTNGEHPVTATDFGAFQVMNSLKYVSIPASLTSFGESTFHADITISSFAVDADSTSFATDGRAIFNKDKTKLIEFAGGSGSHYEIPSTVTEVGGNAFDDDTYLKSVVLPSSLKTIGEFSFGSCYHLQSIAIPASVTKLYNNSFYCDYRLTSITVDAANTAYSADGKALFNKDKTTLITFGASTCTDYEIPSTVTTISLLAFYYSLYIQKLTIPSSVTLINTQNYLKAFFDCNNLVAISYGGTEAQWETLVSNKNDIGLLDTCVVTCSDGSLKWSGSAWVAA